MASSSSPLILSFLSLLIFLPNPTQSQTCKSQKFTTPNKSFSTCSDLSTLGANLHYTYTPSTSTLTMAFTAKPDKSGGWISWAINPIGDGMAGAQSLIAYVKSDGTTVAIDTYNIISYSSLNKGPLTFNVTNLAGESSSSGKITLFASWDLSGLKSNKINHIWQVGPAMKNGSPVKHEFEQANLMAKGKLDLTDGVGDSPVGSPNAAAAAAPGGVMVPPVEAPMSSSGEVGRALAPTGSESSAAETSGSGKSNAAGPGAVLKIGFSVVLGLLGNLLLR